MIPDVTLIRSPEAFAPIAEENANQNNNQVMLKDHAVAIVALVIACVVAGAFGVDRLDRTEIINAKIQAGVAKSAEEAHSANVRSQLTDRDLTILREALQRKGIAIPPKD